MIGRQWSLLLYKEVAWPLIVEKLWLGLGASVGRWINVNVNVLG